MFPLAPSDILTLVALTVSFVVLLTSVTSLYILRRSSRYDERRHQVELELMRRSLEAQMYELNKRLVATEPRWRDVNHLVISSQERQPDHGLVSGAISPESFLRSVGIRDDDIELQRNLVFVLTPFHPEFNDKYQVIAAVCRKLGLVAVRGDEEFVATEIFPHIVKLIVRAQLIIANIDGRNPNVYYELGIAHALGKTTILVAERPEDVPFDIRTKRLLLHRSLGELEYALRDEIPRAIVSLGAGR